jgi:hypothetical protein
MLTREDNWINRADLLARFEEIPAAIDDETLRESVSNYFKKELRARKKPGKPASRKERDAAASETIREYPQLIDYYIKWKEDRGDEAADISAERVLQTELQFSQRLREILHPLLLQTDFYSTAGGTYAEAHARLGYLKHVIEDMGGWRIFYDNEGVAFRRERDVQILYRLLWFGTPSDVGGEANDGRGPVDFKISRGRHKTLIEIKLASNTNLEKNLAKQLETYQVSSDAERGIKAIVFFDDEQLARTRKILKKLGLESSKDVVLIDARNDNKKSASKL